MSIYLRGDVWYYLFYIDGRRYRGSTKTKNRKQAERAEARARVAAEAGESLRPRPAPVFRDFAQRFLDWLEETTLEEKTKADYKNGLRLILGTLLCGLRIDRITADDVVRQDFMNRVTARIAQCGRCAGCWAKPATGNCFARCQGSRP